MILKARSSTASTTLPSGAAYAVQTAVNGGPELLIFVPRAAHSQDLNAEARDAGALPSRGLEVERCDDRGVVGLGILTVDGEGGGLVVQDLVVDF